VAAAAAAAAALAAMQPQHTLQPQADERFAVEQCNEEELMVALAMTALKFHRTLFLAIQ